MKNVSYSLAILVKNNNGMFKSQKQADFLIASCDNLAGNTTFFAPSNCYGNDYADTYHLDQNGVVKVVRYATKSGSTKITWERKDQADFDQLVALKGKVELAHKPIQKVLDRLQQLRNVNVVNVIMAGTYPDHNRVVSFVLKLEARKNTLEVKLADLYIAADAVEKELALFKRSLGLSAKY